MRATELLLIILSGVLLFAIVNAIGERQHKKAMSEIERMEFEDAAILIQQIRQEGMTGHGL